MKGDFIEIDDRRIGGKYSPYIIAELSANHNGNIDTAFKIIEVAKSCGADAIKIQTYRADTITIDCDRPDFQIKSGLWNGRSLYELYDEAHTPWEWHEALFQKAREVGITMFSSPFDTTAVDLLEDLGAPAYKIASFEIVDLHLIKYVAQTKKPLIISTGMANEEEIQEAIETAVDAGCDDLVVLHCVSGYPAPASDFNLRTIPDMARRFKVLTGLSDHSIDNSVAVAAVALGACVIEKHVTLDRCGGGADDSFSLEPEGLKNLCNVSKDAWESIGEVSYKRKDSEKDNVKFRRSLYFVKDMVEGEVVTADNLKSIRPGFGLSPKYYEQVLGRKVVHAVSRGTALKWEALI